MFNYVHAFDSTSKELGMDQGVLLKSSLVEDLLFLLNKN